MDHHTATDLFRKFLSKCRRQKIDEPHINRVLGKISDEFGKADPSYKESEVFKRLLKKEIRNISENPWRSMRTIEEDLRYHTFQANTESNQCSHNGTEYAVLDESLDSTSPGTDLNSPSSVEHIEAEKITEYGSSSSSSEFEEWSRHNSDCGFGGSSSSRSIEDFQGDKVTGYGSSSSDIDEEWSRHNSDCGFDGSSSSRGYTDAEDSQSAPGNIDESVYYDSRNCSSEMNDEGGHESHDNDVDNRGHNQNEFDVEDLISRVQKSFDKSMYDEAECIHLKALAKTNKDHIVQNLKMELTKLNLSISKMGNHEVRTRDDGITSLGKVRSLMGKYLDVYMKICKLNNETSLVKDDVIKFEGTKNLVIDRAIEKFYNERDEMNLPLLDEMCNVIKNVKNDNGESLNLSESKVLEIAIDTLQELGRIRRKQRADKFHDLLSSYGLPHGGVGDPASVNTELRTKLSENEKLSLERMDHVIEKFENRENIRTSRRSSLRRRSVSDSLVELDVGDYLRSMLFLSSDGDE